MLLRSAAHLFLPSLRFSTLPTSLKWRSELQQRRLAAEISSVVLHRRNWIPLLLRCRPNSSSALLRPRPSPELVLRILHLTQSEPDISLNFFRWLRSDLEFNPDLRSLSKMAQILVDADLLGPADHLLAPILRSDPTPSVLRSMLRFASTEDSRAKTLNFLLQSYSNSRMINNSLTTFLMFRSFGSRPATGSCNALLDALCSSNQVEIAWCCYGAVVRSGAMPDAQSWLIIARLFCVEGKPDRATVLLGLGFCGFECYDLLIRYYSQRGDFVAALNLLGEMRQRDLNPQFDTYTSILDGGCKFGDNAVVGSILRELAAQFLDYDSVIARLCESGKSHAAFFFFDKARNENFKLQPGSYSCMLSALSKEGRTDEAVRVYGFMQRERVIGGGIGCIDVFISGICKGKPSPEVNRVLRELIGKGFLPIVADLSKYIDAQCSRGWWKEAGELLDVALEKGALMEPLCCSSLVEHYCTNGLLESAISLHNKLKRLGGSLDSTSYKSLLKALVAETRVEEAIEVFDHMRAWSLSDSACFVIMVGALCHEHEPRKAMELHDEMLQLGLKPDDATYRRLISGFA